ncbi:MAG: lactate racemase domain-containing protein, partial [Candidatus Bathyarchaeia archaeon]
GAINPHPAAAAVSTIVEELALAGASIDDITVVVGNGDRERGDPRLLEALRGPEAPRGVRVVEHGRETMNLSEVGTTSRGTMVEVDGRFAEADIHIAVGEVLLDAYTGFKGAHATILPALAGRPTIEMNRGHAFGDDVAPGVVEGNPVLADVLESAILAGVDFAVNLVADPLGRFRGVRSGGLEESWRQAVADLGDSFRVEVEADPDIVVVSAGGDKFDFDLYHAVWALRSASRIARKGAAIILLAECPEGLGADGLAKLSHVGKLSELRRRFMLGGEAVHLIKSTLRNNRVVLVSALPGFLAEPLGLSAARTANDALWSAAGGRTGRRTMVLTHGCSTLPVAD